MLSRCTPRWRDMGAAVGGTNQGRESGEGKKLLALELGPVCVFKLLRFQGLFICAFEEKVSRV